VDKARPKSVMKLTAVDLFRIYTWFPFHCRTRQRSGNSTQFLRDGKDI